MSFRFSLAANKAQLGSKARAEKEAKERDEEEARKRVLAEFEEEHGEEATNALAQGTDEQEHDPSVFVPQGAKRHFAGKLRSMKSGPGTLDEEPAIAPPARFGGGTRWEPQAMGRGPQVGDNRDKEIFHHIIAKASNLPPDMDERDVEDLFADYKSLKVVKVESVPPTGPQRQQRGGRPSAAMKVTFDEGANSRELEEAMKKLSDKKYLGRGFYLHLDRYRGKAEQFQEPKLPFGAKWVYPDTSNTKFAPTAELSGGTGRPQLPPRETERPKLVITAYPPPDLPTLKLIHTTIESLLEGGMEFEALLMEQPEVQTDERFAWLYDNTHPLNRYYRFRIYQLTTGDTRTQVEIYPGYGEWHGPEPIPNEFAYSLETMEPEVAALDPEAEGDEPLGRIGAQKTADPYPGMPDTGNGYLSMQARAFLIYILASLPTTPVRNLDVAAVTQFAVQHASNGMDEIIDHIINNIFVPHALTPANPRFDSYPHGGSKEGQAAAADPSFQRDKREATLNGLRIVSDICFLSTRVSGRAYKYRDAIGKELLDRGVFEYLETLPKSLQMGRATEDKFRKDVNFIIELWMDERMFSPEMMERINKAFNWRVEQKEKELQERKRVEKRKRAAMEAKEKQKDKERGTSQGRPEGVNAAGANEQDVEMRDDGDADAQETAEDRGCSGRPLSEPHHQQDTRMEDVQQHQQQQRSHPSSIQQAPSSMADGTSAQRTSSQTRDKMDDFLPGETPAARARRLRPKAEDMFASDEE